VQPRYNAASTSWRHPIRVLSSQLAVSEPSPFPQTAITEREHPDVVLMNVRLLGSHDGIDAAEEIGRRVGIGSIFVTANTDAQTRRRAEAVRPLGFLEKPLTEQRLKLGLRSVGSG
jgi:DNA-binding NarL/FixJ family response regulator